MEISVLSHQKLAVDYDYEHRFAEHEVHFPAPSRGLPSYLQLCRRSLTTNIYRPAQLGPRNLWVYAPRRVTP